ncbi:MAG: helix-turn-helix domain-containing protein [Actinomycetota bacterium]|nr:helix-turn-helix domain-containing protein [Actinomycetota bacterium]
MNTESLSLSPGEGRAERASALAALGDPTRLGIMELLASQDLSPDALAGALDVPGNLLAHHLKVLQTAGLIERMPSKNDRRRTYVRSVDGALDGLLPAPSVTTAPRVVFVCTHNSARSILAEALWRASSDVPSSSAGTHPAERIHPRALATARRLHLTVKQGAPQLIDDVLRPDDVVISVCDSVNEELGALDNQHLHWSIPDPAALDTDSAFAATAAELSNRIERLSPCIRSRAKTRTHR